MGIADRCILLVMTVPAGTRIGHFEVAELLGAGGMGAVYRAHDSRLGRDVALKLLPATFAAHHERLKRFEQEARAIARVTHPNIVAVHDVGTHAGVPYIVTELLHGETLRRKLTGRPLPWRQALDYAIQIGSGLTAAHENGVVHRDIKPENLFITEDGRAKILDFGLAKFVDAETETDATAATLTAAALGPLGTAAYMSPEQARGLRADHRSDLFSVGVVLYEMLSAVSPFKRESAAETMTAVIRDDVPPLPEDGTRPPALERLLLHCLDKNVARRFQSARDLVFTLEAVSGDSSPAMRVVQQRPRRRTLAWVALVAMAGTALLAAAMWMTGRRTAEEPGRDTITRIDRLTDLTGLEEFPAIAPDLKSVAFVTRVRGYRQVFVRLLAGGNPLQITKGETDHESPRWSADASTLLYFSPATGGSAQGTIWEIPALGGAPRRVIDSIGSGDVSATNRVACFRMPDGHVELVDASRDGSDARVITRFDEAGYYAHPRWSPDGNWIAYQRGDGFRWNLFVIAVSGGTPRQLTADNTQIHGFVWLPDSSGVVYSSSRSVTMPYLPTLGLWQLHLDGRESTRVAAADVSYSFPDMHRSGVMVASRMQMRFDIWQYAIDGSAVDNTRRGTRVTRQTGQVQTPTVGTSDEQIAFLSDSGGHANLWVTTPATGEMRQVTYERDPAVALGVPIWSPDGRWIAFVSSRGEIGLEFGLWVVNPDGGNLRNLVPHGLGAAWSTDSQWVYYVGAGVVYRVPIAGGAPIRVRQGPARNVIGHDGRTLYFMVDRTLADGVPGFEIHAASPEDAPSRVLAHIPASRAPQWQIINPSLSPDGRWLAMPLTDGQSTNVWALSPSTGEWRQITDFEGRATFIARRVAWSADSRSVLAAVGEGDADIVAFFR
jgi:Tol biopolymer transport system component